MNNKTVSLLSIFLFIVIISVFIYLGICSLLSFITLSNCFDITEWHDMYLAAYLVFEAYIILVVTMTVLG